MDSLSPHIEHRVSQLHREAEVRRLAASASGSHGAPTPRRRGRRAIAVATAFLALATAIGASGAYLVAAGTESARPGLVPVMSVTSGSDTVGEAGPAAQPFRPAGGGVRLHR